MLKKKWKRVLKSLLWIGLGLIVADTVYRFGVELITVPSASMEKSIPAGDFVWVNKLIPGSRLFPNRASFYFRLPGWRKIKYNDVVVFNFPDADTIFDRNQQESYHYLKRQYPDFDRLVKSGQWGRLKYLKVSKRPRMIKRVVALPGETIQIAGGALLINDVQKAEVPTVIRLYRWMGPDQDLADMETKLRTPAIQRDHVAFFELTDQEFSELGSLATLLKPELLEKNFPDINIFPFQPLPGWNADFMGPVYLPKKGDQVDLNVQNLPIYHRMISVFEGNEVAIRNHELFINNQPVTSYTFKLSYYWVLGDNRPHSFDSRYWGPVPENHIVGVAGAGSS